MSPRTRSLFTSLGLASCLALAACGDTSQFTRTMQNFTKKVHNFTARTKSQNGFFNPSRVTMSGRYTLGPLTVAADESRLLTPAQLQKARSALRMGGVFAEQDHDDSKIAHWEAVGHDFMQFTTDNDVLVFRIRNKGYDPVDLGAVRFLLLDASGSRKPQMRLSVDTRKVLDLDAHFVAGPDNKVVKYTTGDMGVVPALTTVYRAVIIPGMNAGHYTALLTGVPGARGVVRSGRLSFAVQKH